MNRREKTVNTVLALLFIAFLCFVAVVEGHCSVTTKTNSIGIPVYDENPYMYTVGAIVGGDVIVSDKSIAVSLRLHPYGTPLLFDQNVVFCGKEAAVKLLGDNNELREGWLVFTYYRAASRTVDGIGCHMLMSVDTIKEKP